VTARVIDGKAVAAAVRERVAAEVASLPAAPGLATVLVGDDPASAVYVRMKREDSAQVGIRSFHHEPAPGQVEALLEELNADPAVNGILLQLPLPDGLDDAETTALIDPRKDVDGLTALSAGLLAQGRPGLVPCTPAGVMELLSHAGVELEGADAVVVGRS
jgi:methylenetetrahydrofolate dehydrogenase (NADP+) / methenyltetrahydrofolate cyclohydrolase